MIEDRKLRLAVKLKEEKDNLPEYDIFGGKNNTSEYDDTINYLKTGSVPLNFEDNDLLLSCMEDLETMFYDYGVK